MYDINYILGKVPQLWRGESILDLCDTRGLKTFSLIHKIMLADTLELFINTTRLSSLSQVYYSSNLLSVKQE